MWTLIAVLLISWNGVFGTSDICNERVSSVCLSSSSRPSFPETEEELEKVCQILLTAFRCVRNYAERCEIETAEVKEIETFSEALTEICREDTLLHSNVVQNLPCLKDIFQHAEQQCQGFTRNAINHLYEQVMNAGNANGDENHVYRVFDCLFVSIQAHCFVTQTVEKCGSRAKDAVLEIMEKSRLVDEECPGSVQKEVLELLNVLALATEEEVHVKRLLGGKK
ncbi:uncharacterized protein LOC129984065 [Argiope bruennichi]|nr:uncharacterized protein LOC129984065 [Argiope bruennichi]